MLAEGMGQERQKRKKANFCSESPKGAHEIKPNLHDQEKGLLAPCPTLGKYGFCFHFITTDLGQSQQEHRDVLGANTSQLPSARQHPREGLAQDVRAELPFSYHSSFFPEVTKSVYI